MSVPSTPMEPTPDASPTHPLPVADWRVTVGYLMRGLRTRGVRLLALVVAMIVSGALGLVTPRLFGHIVDVVADGGDVGDVVRLAGWMVAAAIGAAVAAGIGMALAAGVFESVLASLREEMISRALRLPVARIEAAGSGDLVSRATGDVAVVSDAIGRALPSLLVAGVTVGVTIIGLGTLDWRFLLVAVAVLPIHYVGARLYIRYAPALYANEREANAVRAHHVLGPIRGLETVRAFELSHSLEHRIDRHSWDVVRWAMRASVLQNRLGGRINFGEFVGMTTILVVGFVLVNADEVTVGATTAAMLFFLNLFDPIGALLYTLDDLQSGGAALSRIVGVIDEPERESATDTAPRGADLVGTGIDFGYLHDHEVLHDVSLTVRSGEHVALVGQSGAGKSTLAVILAGLYPPAHGSVRLGSVDLARLDETARARTVALLTQEVHVFSGSLADDLRLVRDEATDDDLWSALEKAGAARWVRALPDNLDTHVGEHGHQLSAMQAQQLALVRIELLDPSVVIVDEATADAGSAGAGVLEASAEAVLAGRSALIIAHRLSQAAAADRIVFMHQGRIVETGTHEHLVAAGGRYSRLWQAWSRGRTLAE
ncbi:ABC transporter ATP-binding protein [Williamsia sterculiae]|uniref:ATP-binding cassette, subfamily C n=1 Tax=Williamsia sterculiae TaxID=1344003 RepID=A0A1N7ENG4_9NOCA|nr:ABC transporter ATP-binding protein [Williamsia sterculiae]SIR89592.1 ATP-binding cassette, subfamily C [Williamsia sterculiae]